MYKDRLGFQCRDSSDVLAEENAALKADRDRVEEILGALAPGGSIVNMAIAARGVIAALKAENKYLKAPDAQKEKI